MNYWREHPRMRGNYVHPEAWVSENVELGFGNYIEAGAIIGAAGHLRGVPVNEMGGKIIIGNNNRIGANTVIHYGNDGETIIGSNNMIMAGCNIGHDVIIGDGVEICPNVLIAGHCDIGDDCKIKQGSIINTMIEIAKNTFIYSGSIVTHNVSKGSYKGQPAKKIR